ncbi:MAG: riboflavin synthase subunit alpha [Polyangiales bacterium]
MFTGITRGVFPVVATEDHPGFTRFTVRVTPELARDVQNGASVAIDGVCCTVIEHTATDLTFDAVQETRSLTTLSELKVGRGVSVERSCRIGDELGGHDVSGHVVGTGVISQVGHIGEQLDLTIQVPAAWMRFILHKGFIAIDGSSLTVGEVRQAGEHGSFDIHLIPETLRLTNFGKKAVGARVNVELDPRTVAIVETVERVLAERAQRGSL